MNPNRSVVLGVSGGIAAYKAAVLTSRLAQADWDVRVVLTAAAQKFIGEPTFAALSGHPVATDAFDNRFPLGAHIELAQGADTLCVAPATADFLAKMANGFADDLLSTLYLCFEGPVFVAPAMNDQMWKQPSVQRNVQQLSDDGVQFIGPQDGWLSCRQRGVGRMADPDDIFKSLNEATA